MRVSRFMMVIAAACFIASSLTEAQGRRHEPAGRGPQTGKTPGDSGSKGRKAGSGTAGEGRGNGGHPNNAGKSNGNGGHPNNAGEDRGNANGRGDTDNDQDTPGRGPRRGGSDKEQRASFVAKMNPQQRARLEAMLPSGVTLEQAADGFRNKGQFIAALQESQNHHVSFVDLKAQMTGDNPLSLGQAMRKLAVQTEED